MVNIYEDLKELEQADGTRKTYTEGDAPAELPAEYYTVSEDSTSDNLSADNQAKEILYEFTLTFYTTKAESIYNGILDAIAVLKKKGYIISGVGYGASSYKDWYARGLDIKKIEYLERN